MESEDHEKRIEALEKQVAAMMHHIARLEQDTKGRGLLAALREAEQRYG